MFPNQNPPFSWTVIELQCTDPAIDAWAVVPPVCFTVEDPAIARFCQTCAAAALSSVPYHAVFVLRSDGMVTERRVFDRRGDLVGR